MRGFLLVGDQSGFEKEMDYGKKLFESMGFEVDEVNLYDINVIVSNDDNGKISLNGEMVDCPDFVMVSSVKERETYQFKAVMRMFESMGVNCINPLEAIEKTADKLHSFQLANEYVPELKIPKTMLIGEKTSVDDIEKQIGFPLVLKIMEGLQGKGVSLIKTKEELDDLLNIITASKFENELIAQEAIMSSKGRDIRVVVGGGEVIHSFVRSNENDFKSNIHQGGSIEEFKAPQSLIDISIKLADAFNLKLGSIDFLFGEKDDEFYLCEINSTPGISYVLQGDEKTISKFLSIQKKIITG